MSDTDDNSPVTDLRADGVRVTRQRVAILQVLRDANDHPRADDILARAKAVDPSVSLATVYYRLGRRADGQRHQAIVEQLKREEKAREDAEKARQQGTSTPAP